MADPRGSIAGQNLFTPISQPVLRKLRHKNIRKFLRDRENYLLKIEDAKTSGSTVKPISVVSSVDRDLLQSLLDIGELDEVESLEQLTDDVLKKWLETQVAEDFDSLTVDSLRSAIKRNVRMNVHETDPKLRVKTLFTDFVSFLRSKNWSDLIKKNPGLAIEEICSLLKPTELKDK